MQMEKIVNDILKLSPEERQSILAITMRYVIETGELEASSIRATLNHITNEG